MVTRFFGAKKSKKLEVGIQFYDLLYETWPVL